MHDAKGNAVTIDLTEDTTHRRFGAATLPARIEAAKAEIEAAIS